MGDNMFEHYFEGRCPSKAQVMKVIKQALGEGATNLEISWGENMLTLLKNTNGLWYGYGWIRRISGSDIAEELA